MHLNNKNDLFEQIEKRKNIIKIYQTPPKKNAFSQKNDGQIILEEKNKNLDKNLISLYRLHSSKFHTKKEYDEYSKNTNIVLNKEINLLKKERNNVLNESQFSSKKSNNIEDLNKFRKNMAFRFRFLNSSPKNKNCQKSFRSNNIKMNRILQISKSIPDIFFHANKTMQNDMKNNNLSNENMKNIEKGYLYRKNKGINEYGYISPFKGNRYIGNIYNYYKSNNCLKEDYLIFAPNKNKNNNNIYEKIYNDEQNSFNNKSKNKKYLKRNNDINWAKIKKNKKFGMIHLSSLLI